MKRLFGLGLTLLVSAGLLTAWPSTAQPVAAATAGVDVIDDAYSPVAITIDVGDTVLWTWMGSNQHTVSSNSSETFDSGAPQTTGTFSHTFNTAGSFAYLCGVHGLAMQGTVVVQEPVTNTPVAATNTPLPATATLAAGTATSTGTTVAATPTIAGATQSPVAGATVAANATAIPTRVAIEQAPEAGAGQQSLPRAGSGRTHESRSMRWLALAFAVAGIVVVMSAVAARKRRE